jgi:uncharacterized protein
MGICTMGDSLRAGESDGASLHRFDMGPRRFRRLSRTGVQGVVVPVAERLPARLLGLAFLSRAAAGPGLLIPRCRAVHGFGMRFELRVLYLDADGEIVRESRLSPWGFAACHRAESVLELPVWRPCARGSLRGTPSKETT